jgi:hypothetical protein
LHHSLINVVQGRLPDYLVNSEAKHHPRVRAWSGAA